MKNNPRISAIVALDERRGIGKNGTIPWKIPGEQLRFKNITMGHPVIMGRKTYESIPSKFRPLVGRPNIVITRSSKWNPHEDIHIVNAIDNALELAKSLDTDEIFILGGSQIFESTMDMIDRIYLTLIHDDCDADTFFPDYSRFTKIISNENNEQDGVKFDYVILER